jgi:predicted Rossmann-fold nucleotide-binding protein
VQIFVSGTWKPEKAAAYVDQAHLLGHGLAEAGFDLACGPGTGIARHVIDAYRSVNQRGVVRYYLPTEEAMRAAGEEVEPGADEIERLDLDYPMRNVAQVKASQGLFLLTGGDGALEEIIPAIIDYDLPVAVVEGAGTAAAAVRALLEIYPEWQRLVRLGPDVQSLLEDFIDRVRASSA